MTAAGETAALDAQRARIRDGHLKPLGERPTSTARGLHHTALVSSDVERTVRFYQGVLGFPLTELTENRDYPGSSMKTLLTWRATVFSLMTNLSATSRLVAPVATRRSTSTSRVNPSGAACSGNAAGTSR